MKKKKFEKELNKLSSETIHILATKLTEQEKLIDKMAEWIDDRCFYSDEYGNSCEIIQDTCNNPDELHKKYYKDIKICKEWESFENFRDWAHKNGYQEGYTIERLDIKKGYYPENCTWIPKELQNINKRNKSHLIIDGIDKSYTEWANEYGIRENTIRTRVKSGYIGKDLIKPTKKYGPSNPFIRKKKEGEHY